ncbi:SDR family NAD(P)-dependent oxidoreductase [Flavobacterium arcticum]|uniref:SDR family NAD(P)-dependent oxidoreductase n=1 Tax=Flavobacterium arcticum TaxID=1784713 RepID=A0A345HBL0_9FLAO|nr:SDR family oxidoreductase [Flavobacterium arcticum]AXG73970.1 SDR family NAD(P)-dependent oxidoreductase [Flavobacterium arcticum]KAF2508946.1 SDR family oxidoreductase [Flavobacterium arcticum]
MATYIFAGASSGMAMQAATLLQEQGHKVIGVSTKEDTGNYNQWYKVQEYGFGAFPAIDAEIDGLVYFPGTINLKPFHRINENDFTTDFTISALGAAAFVQAYLPQLKKSAIASIVFISTVAVGTGMPFHASVAMAKGAVEGLTRSLAAEYAPKVRVNCVAPSLTDTPLAGRLLASEDKMEAAKNRNPLKKIGTPNDLAQAITFLLGANAAWVTGQVLAVDGGMNKLRLL